MENKWDWYIRYNDTIGAQSKLWPVGALQRFPNSIDTTGWVKCCGQLLQVSMFPKLYAVIGKTYGYDDSDGIPRFKLPTLHRTGFVSERKKRFTLSFNELELRCLLDKDLPIVLRHKLLRALDKITE